MPAITYNIPADKQADVIAALRLHYNKPDATPAQLNVLIADDLKNRIRNIYIEYMRRVQTYDVSLD